MYVKSRLIISNYLPKTVWDAEFKCEGHLSGVTGSNRGRNSSKQAVEGAIKDFIVKAYNAGKITPEDLVSLG